MVSVYLPSDALSQNLPSHLGFSYLEYGVTLHDRMTSLHFQGKPYNITVMQVYAPTSYSEETQVEQFYEDLQDLLELTPKKDLFFIKGDWNGKVGSQETPGVTSKFGLGVSE